MGLSFVALLSTFFALLVYKYFSNQSGIKRSKEKLKAYFVEQWLYIDDPVLILRAQARIIMEGARYLSYTLVPLAIMVFPMMLVLVNMEYRYHYRAFRKGEKILVKLKAENEICTDSIRFELPLGLKLDGGPLGATITEKGKEKTMIWFRILVEEEGEYEACIFFKDKRLKLPIIANPEQVVRLNPVELKNSFNRFFHPGLSKIGRDIPLEEIRISYPEFNPIFFRWKIWWLWQFIIFMFVFGFLLKRLIKVEF